MKITIACPSGGRSGFLLIQKNPIVLFSDFNSDRTREESIIVFTGLLRAIFDAIEPQQPLPLATPAPGG